MVILPYEHRPIGTFPPDGPKTSRHTCRNIDETLSQHTEPMPATSKEHALGRIKYRGSEKNSRRNIWLMSHVTSVRDS